MNKRVIVSLAFAALSFPAWSQQPGGNQNPAGTGGAGMGMKGTNGMEMKGMDMKAMDMKANSKPSAGKSATHHVTGTVTKADNAANTVVLDHGPVKSLNWPAMTMSFKVADKAFLDKLRPGTKADVEVVQRGKDYVITEIH